jgi:3-methyladenine DNA glycosylase AlkD
MGGLAEVIDARIVAAFEPRRDEERAGKMSAYMRNLFPFLGIPSPGRSALTGQALQGLPRPAAVELAAAARTLWGRREREYQYAAVDLVTRNIKACDASFLDTLRWLITTKSWWDTVDALASNALGPLARSYPALTSELDRWIEDSNVWLARSAILYQLKYRSRTDPDRLFRYCLLRAHETEFFLRKAIGWALREYSKTDAMAVRRFVSDHDSELSLLSQREALLWLNGGRSKDPVRASARA